MSTPVNQQTVRNNYEGQQYIAHLSPVPHNSQNIYPVLTAQSPPLGHFITGNSSMVQGPNFQPQWTATVPQKSCLNFYEAFLEGKPKALGILVIIVAILEIGLGVAVCFTAPFFITFFSFTPFWCPVFYIIAGSLTAAAQSRPSICLVQGSLAMNVISCLFSLSATAINACDIAFHRCNYYGISNYYYYGSSSYYQRECQLYWKYGIVVLSLLLVANTLLFFVTLSTSIFGCISMSRLNATLPQQLMIRNDAVFAMHPGAVPMTAVTYGQSAGPPQPLPVNIDKV